MKWTSYWLPIMLFLWPCILQGQERLLDKANERYKEGAYAEAIPLFEEALLLEDDLAASARLAASYRKTNQLEEAEEWYARLVRNERARDDALYYYGEVLMCNGKYSEAADWFRKYLERKPGDEKAVQLIRSCTQVDQIVPLYTDLRVIPFSRNSEADDNSPVFWRRDIVFSSDRRIGLRLLKQRSGWTGRDFIRIYHSTYVPGEGFDEPDPFSSRLNELNKNSGYVSFTHDGMEVFFTRNSSSLDRRHTYNLQLFGAHRQGDDKWRDVAPLDFCNPAFNYMHPAISPDGRELFFVSDRPGGVGGTDLYHVRRKGLSWGRPENLGEVVNTVFNEGFPFMDGQGRLFFCSKGHIGYGGFDIFYTERDAEGRWKPPVNVGQPINSPLDDISLSLEPNGAYGMFASSRENGDDDIYLFFPGLENGPYDAFVENHLSRKGLVPVVPAKSAVTVTDTLETWQTEDLPAHAGAPPADSSSTFPVKTQREADPDPYRQSDVPAGSRREAEYRSGLAELELRSRQGSLQKGQLFRLDSAVFGFEEYTIEGEVKKVLDRLVAVLETQPVLRIEIGGHTEALGNDTNNQTLSRYRAEAAAAYLVSKGISPNRIMSKGYGESHLLNDCRRAEDCDWRDHLFNQRLEVKIL